MFDYFKFNFFQLIAKLSIFTLLIAFFAYFSVDTILLLSNSGNQYAIEVYEYDGSEEEKKNESARLLSVEKCPGHILSTE